MMRRAGPVWLFDLDNTLHDADRHLLPGIGRAMQDYMAGHMGMGEAQAHRLRLHYWQRYGATLLGLMRHHAVDPHHFLRMTHDFADLDSLVFGSPRLAEVLRRLPGRKLVFSNAPAHYCRAVLQALGVERLFEGVFTIEHSRFRPKPDPRGFRRLLAQYGLDPRRCIMVEDTVVNLRTARKLGMQTVWIGRGPARAAYVDLIVPGVAALPRHLGCLRGVTGEMR